MIFKNFDAYWNCKIIRDILENHNQVPTKLHHFNLTLHEKDVLSAFDDLIKFSKQSIVKHKWNVNASTLQKYTEIIQNDSRLIQWVLLLHDIAKDRDFPDPHPEESYQIIHQFKNEIQPATRLSETDWGTLEWLVRYHDVLGNINTGERHPNYLKKIIDSIPQHTQLRCLQLLALITLCDVQGTNKGMYLTDDKARFWIQLSESQYIDQLSAQFLEHRIRRWTGDLLTEPHRERAYKFRKRLDENKTMQLFQTVWGSQITHVVHGIYLFIELAESDIDLLYSLLEKIALFCQQELNKIQNIQIVFTPYKPWRENHISVFHAYKEKIASNALKFNWDPTIQRLEI